MKRGNVSLKSVYGGEGRHGPAISELEHRGLVEPEFFLEKEAEEETSQKFDFYTKKKQLDEKLMNEYRRLEKINEAILASKRNFVQQLASKSNLVDSDIIFR